MTEVILNDECMHCETKECHDGYNFCNQAMKKNSFYKNAKLYKGLEVIQSPTYEELEKEAEGKYIKKSKRLTHMWNGAVYQEGYKDGAEPREKQIDELKAQIKVLEQNLEDTEICENGLKNRIAELEAQIEEMKWHKVSDGDFPKVTGDYITNIGVLTYDHYGNNIYKWHTPFCEACDYGDEVDDDEVIAWCEIPKYTKEIKEK